MTSALVDAGARRATLPAAPNGRVALPGSGDEAWGGGDGRGPRIALPVLATVFLVAAEVMLFAGLIFAFWVLRLAAPVWPPPLQPRLPVAVTGANTLVLLASSATLLAAGRALRRGARPAFLLDLGSTGLLGALFLAVQGREWARLVGFGLTVASGTYGATFYVLIGTHAVHVVAALGWLGVVLALAARGRFADGRTAPVQACALYWHFVVGLWPVLYLTVYLL